MKLDTCDEYPHMNNGKVWPMNIDDVTPIDPYVHVHVARLHSPMV